MRTDADLTIESWMQEYGDSVLRTVYVITRHREASEEIAQEVFVRAWKKLHLFAYRSSPRTWLYRIAVNLARNYLRKRRELFMNPNHAAFSTEASREPGPETSVLSQEAREEVRRAVESLPFEHRIVVALYYLEELSVTEVAAVAGIPAGTVKSRLAGARKKLRCLLAEGGDDE